MNDKIPIFRESFFKIRNKNSIELVPNQEIITHICTSNSANVKYNK